MIAYKNTTIKMKMSSTTQETCETKEQIEYILALYKISYNWSTEKSHFYDVGGSGFCYIYPSTTLGKYKYDANVNFMQTRTEFKTGKRLIGILRDSCKINVTDPSDQLVDPSVLSVQMTGLNAQWIAIGRLATIVEKLSRQH